jgi:hypothetical protein
MEKEHRYPACRTSPREPSSRGTGRRVSEAIAFYINADPHAALYYKNRRTTSCSQSTSRATSKVRLPSVHDAHSQPDRPVRTSLPRYSKSQLTSTKMLSQRSAVPTVVSRATTPSSARISRADKERLLRVAKRPRKGPLNAIMDPTDFGAGSAAIDDSHAVEHSRGHDLWDVPAVEEIVPEG